LAEKHLEFILKPELVWKRRSSFLALNPTQVKLLFLEDTVGMIISDSMAICAYLDEAYPDLILFGKELFQRAELKLLVAWFDSKFNKEVTCILVFEKTMKRYFGLGASEAKLIRQGNDNINLHMECIGWLTGRRNWLAGLFNDKYCCSSSFFLR
jgi:glutathione S-transferase